MRVYLAGPDVFLPHPLARAAALKAICARHGLDGVCPLDPLADEPASWAGLAEHRRIALRNEAHIRSCDALIANLSPFRGPGADAGTAYEMGFARALGQPVFAWTSVADDFTARTMDWLRGGGRRDGDGWRDDAGLSIEAFGLVDNLMLDNAVLGSGGAIAVPAEFEGQLACFERCVAAAAGLLAQTA